MKRCFVLLFSMICAQVFGEFNPFSVPDSSEVRKAIGDKWFYDSVDTIRMNTSEMHSNSLGEKFQVRLEETDSNFAVIVAPQVMMDVVVYTEKGTEKLVRSEFPFDANGSWVLIRNSETGLIERLKMYFSNNSDMYVQFYSQDDKVFVDFVIAGYFINRGIPLGLSLEDLYNAAFKDIYELTKNRLPWNYAEIYPGLYDDKRQMIGVIRKLKNRFFNSEDGCYDENGKPIYATTGESRKLIGEEASKISVSSAGFLKWVIDGLIEPISGAGTFYAPLRRPSVIKDSNTMGEIIEEKDEIPLNFTLDWCRNLAAARVSVQSRKKYLYEESGVDVNLRCISGEVTETGAKNVSGFIENSGYRIEMLKPVLHILGATEPGYGYLAAVRRTVPPKKGHPEYYFFDQCAVIFPYFDGNGRFVCTIFENGKELTLAQFTKKYRDSSVYLTRFMCSDKFFPLGYEVPEEKELNDDKNE